ncbi:MAG: ABC transporter permease subunit [Alphaproteobacteria bacterium]|nr:ABC transporter permease subunit [Alphaproteobacteria bacterium]
MNFSIIFNYIPDLFQGFLLTLELTFYSLALGLILAFLLAILKLSSYKIISQLAKAYIFFFRGTPILIQIYLIYYGFGQINIQNTFLWLIVKDAYSCALIALTLNTAAYTAEILQGAFKSVPLGEIEAGKACGMSKLLLFRRIILPISIRYILPAYSNEIILMLHASSLTSIITLMDLTGIARKLASQTLLQDTFFITIAAIYLAITYSILGIYKLLEKHLYKHLDKNQ